MAVANKTFHEENVAVRDMAFWSTPLTDNITVTPEGYLCCHNVKVARTGVQWYQGKEISHKLPVNQRFKVYRLAEDVGAEETLKSIEGKSVTDGHPTNFVDPSNHHIYEKGHGQNVRFDGMHQTLDLMIKDKHMIKQVMDGKREISLGYYCGYVPYKDGFKQINIRVNHIAIVPNGRAGSQVRIVDSALQTGVKKPMSKYLKQARAIKAMADGGLEPEAIAEFLETSAVKTTDAAPAAVVATAALDEGFFDKLFKKHGITGKKTRDEEEEKKEEEKKAEDARIAAVVDARMKPVVDAIEQLTAAIGKKPKKTVDTKSPEAIIAALLGKSEDAETDARSKVMLALGLDEDEDEDDKNETEDEDEDDEDDKKAEDAALKQMKQLKPYIAKLPKAQQVKVIDQLSKGLGRGKSKSNNYAGILNVINKKTQDSNKQVDWKNLGDEISKAHNPHRINERKQA